MSCGVGRPLAGLRVLATRPARQNRGLCRKLEAAGAVAVTMPLLEILPADDSAAVRELLGAAGEYDWAIFTSPNAVEYATALAPPAACWPARVAAVGQGSAQTLVAAGIADDVLIPGQGFTSEHLLAEQQLQSVTGARVLLVSGEGGRDVLRQTLAQRGARVDRAEVYRRRPVDIEAQTLRTNLAQCDVAVVTSSGALAHLLETAHAAGAVNSLQGLKLVVPSARVLKQALDWGIRQRPWIPARVSDADIVAVLIERIAEDGRAGTDQS